MLSLKLIANEWEGLVSATRAHNSALVEKVQHLAKRVEDLTRSSGNVELLKDEFYHHCKEYIEKKKIIGESNKLIEAKLEKEREIKGELEN
jgi:predicted transcriptional regulator